jgi:hypothetical protein
VAWLRLRLLDQAGPGPGTRARASRRVAAAHWQWLLLLLLLFVPTPNSQQPTTATPGLVPGIWYQVLVLALVQQPAVLPTANITAVSSTEYRYREPYRWPCGCPQAGFSTPRYVSRGFHKNKSGPRTPRPPSAPTASLGFLVWSAEGLPSTHNWPFRWPLPPATSHPAPGAR